MAKFYFMFIVANDLFSKAVSNARAVSRLVINGIFCWMAVWRMTKPSEVLAKSCPIVLITKAHMNLQNYADMKKPSSIKAGEFYDLQFKLQPTYYTLPVGSKLGLIIYSTDQGMTKRPLENTDYTIDLAETAIKFSTK